MSGLLTIAFFTGASDPGRCALSPGQVRFLEQLSTPERRLIRANFPYRASEPYREVSLPRASWHNVRGYLQSRTLQFRSEYRPDVEALVHGAERLVFLAGSCGLELFNNLLLPAELERKCHLICYGPVARHLPRHAQACVVQSRRDWISRLGFRWPEQRLDCGHMDYLVDPLFLHHCRTELSTLERLSCFSTSA